MSKTDSPSYLSVRCPKLTVRAIFLSTSWIKILGFLGRAVCDSGARCGPDLVVRGSSVARVAPTFLYEFAAGFLFRCCFVVKKFSSVRGE